MLRPSGRIAGFFTEMDDERDALSHFLQDARQAEAIGLLIGIDHHRHLAALRELEVIDAGRDPELRDLAGLAVCTWPQIRSLAPDQAAMSSLVSRLRAGRATDVCFWCGMAHDPGSNRDNQTLAAYQNQFASAVSERDCMLVCAYNPNAMGGAALMDLLSIHPLVLTRAGIQQNALHASLAEQSIPSSAIADLRRINRDLVALSMLPATWKDQDPPRIIDDLARSIASMVGADIVGTTALDDDDTGGLRLAFATSDAGDGADIISLVAARVAGVHPEAATDDVVAISSPSGMIRALCLPIGIKGDAQLVVASRDPGFPTELQRMLLRVGANLAAISVDRWRAESEEYRLATLVENSSDFIGIASLEGMALYVNSAGRKLTGLDNMAQLRRIKILDFAMPDERARMRDECWPLVTSTGRWQGEMYLRSFQTGAAIPFLIDWFLIEDRRPGHPTVMATVSRDLTAQKRSEAQLRQLSETLELQVLARTDELAEANKQLRREVAERALANARLQELQSELARASRFSTVAQVAGALAHEIAQPLGAAINYVNTARRFLTNPTGQAIDQAKENMDDAALQVLRAGRITDRVRDFVGGGDTDRQVENVGKLIEEAIFLAIGNPTALHIELFRDIAEDHLLVFADAIQIQQVLVNLVRNAIEAMANSDRRELHVTATRVPDDLIRITVADSGPGVPRDLVPRLFQPFATSKRDGMGLGLAICRSIIEAHGGALLYEPGPSGGAIFGFTIPAARGEANGQ